MDGKTLIVATLALAGLAACGATVPGGGAEAATQVDPLVAAMGEGDELADQLGAPPPGR